MPRCFVLDDTDIATAAFRKPLVAGMIVYLLVNIQRFLRMLMPFHPLPQPLFSEVPKPLYPEGFRCHLWVEITQLWYRVDLGCLEVQVSTVCVPGTI